MGPHSAPRAMRSTFSAEQWLLGFGQPSRCTCLHTEAFPLRTVSLSWEWWVEPNYVSAGTLRGAVGKEPHGARELRRGGRNAAGQHGGPEPGRVLPGGHTRRPPLGLRGEARGRPLWRLTGSRVHVDNGTSCQLTSEKRSQLPCRPEGYSRLPLWGIERNAASGSVRTWKARASGQRGEDKRGHRGPEYS